MMPRIYVGTMWAGEGGFDRCVEAIAKQKNVSIAHQVVAYKPEREAHSILYSTWESVKHNYDAFVQVDADTELIDHKTISLMYELLQEQSKNGKTSLQSPLYDYLTCRNIAGLNMYLPTVRFKEPSELFCDRCTENNVTYLGTPARYSCVGRHAEHSTAIQSYRFGVHRGLKRGFGDDFNAIVKAIKDAHSTKISCYGENEGLWPGFEFVPQELALCGFFHAERFRGKKFDYDSDELHNEFNAIKESDIREYVRKVL